MNRTTHLALRDGVIADCSGALYLEASETLLIADAHLGYAWAQRRRGELGPLTDGGIVDRLRSALDRWNPGRIVFLGDVVHRGRPSAEERHVIESALHEAAGRTRLVAVLGNHDRNFESDFGNLNIECCDHWEDADILAVHGDRDWPDTKKWLVLGHLHPAISLEDSAGATRRLPVFMESARALVLPAFSPFAAGFNLHKALPREWQQLFCEGYATLSPVTGKQVRRLPRPFQLRFRPPGLDASPQQREGSGPEQL